MKKVALLILLLLLILAFPSIAISTCGNMTFSTLGQGGAEDILIYSFDGSQQTLLGQWNTSSPDVPAYCGDVNIVVRPSAQGHFNDPALLLQDGFTFVSTYYIYIFAILFLFAAAWSRL